MNENQIDSADSVADVLNKDVVLGRFEVGDRRGGHRGDGEPDGAQVHVGLGDWLDVGRSERTEEREDERPAGRTGDVEVRVRQRVGRRAERGEERGLHIVGGRVEQNRIGGAGGPSGRSPIEREGAARRVLDRDDLLLGQVVVVRGERCDVGFERVVGTDPRDRFENDSGTGSFGIRAFVGD